MHGLNPLASSAARAAVGAARGAVVALAAARGGTETSADATMNAAGATTIGCHLHGSTRAYVFVGPTPWVAVTDATGRAVLTFVPDGATALRLWHPTQQA